MRTDEERLKAMHKRAEQIARRNQVRKAWGITAAAIAASIALIVLVGMSMPGIVDGERSLVQDQGMSARVFSSSSILGYVVIAILAFALGVSVTILCVRLKRARKS